MSALQNNKHGVIADTKITQVGHLIYQKKTNRASLFSRQDFFFYSEYVFTDKSFFPDVFGVLL